MKRLSCFVFLLLVMSSQAVAAQIGASREVVIQDLVLSVPEGWTLKQNAKDAGTIILGFEQATTDEYVTLFAKDRTGLNMRAIFANGAEVLRDVHELPRNELAWSVLETRKRFAAWNRTFFITSFLLEKNGVSYYGYVRTESSSRSNEIAQTFLNSIR